MTNREAIIRRLQEGDFLHHYADPTWGWFWHGYGRTPATPKEYDVSQLLGQGKAVIDLGPHVCGCKRHVTAPRGK